MVLAANDRHVTITVIEVATTFKLELEFAIKSFERNDELFNCGLVKPDSVLLCTTLRCRRWRG